MSLKIKKFCSKSMLKKYNGTSNIFHPGKVSCFSNRNSEIICFFLARILQNSVDISSTEKCKLSFRSEFQSEKKPSSPNMINGNIRIPKRNRIQNLILNRNQDRNQNDNRQGNWNQNRLKSFFPTTT